MTDNIDSLVFDTNFAGTASSLYECGLIRRKVAHQSKHGLQTTNFRDLQIRGQGRLRERDLTSILFFFQNSQKIDISESFILLPFTRKIKTVISTERS